ncbi:MAG: hypothetical protein WDO18_08505 [Acidobacteriota bacterium]
MKQLLLCLTLSALAFGQDASWDNSPPARQLADQASRLKPLLNQLTPEAWVAKGAPDTYVKQWRSAQQELDDLTNTALHLDQQPQRLTIALDTYFRLQSLEWRMESLIEAARRYQGPAAGDQMLSVLRANATHRDTLRQYISELAARKEQEFTIVNRDAQLCRQQLTEIPTAIRRTQKR